MISRRIAVVLVLPTCWGAAAPAQEFALPRRLAPGRYVLTAECTRSQVLTVNDVPRPSLATRTTLVLAMQVGAPGPDDNALVELSFRRIAQSVTTRRKTVIYDSSAAEPQASRLQYLLAPLLKAKIRLALTPAGRVTQVKGLDAIWDARALKDPDVAKWVNQVKAEMGNEMLGDLLDQVGRVLPDEPVRKGQTWQRQMRFRLPYVGEEKRRQDVVLKKVEKQGGAFVAILSLDKEINERPGSIVQVEPMPLTVQRMQVSQKGQLRLGLKTVSPVRLQLTRVSTLTMSGTDPTRGAVTVQLKHTDSTDLSIRPQTRPEPRTE